MTVGERDNPAMTSPAHSGQTSSGRRAEVLRILAQAAGPRTIGEIAAHLDAHPNTVRFHLDALCRTGQVERAEPDRRGTGRPPLRYRAVRVMDPTGPRHYRLLAEILVQDLAAEPRSGRRRAAQAGRAWGRHLAAAPAASRPVTDVTNPQESVRWLMTLLDELGFAPERRQEIEQQGDGRQGIGLRHCPFLELAEARSDIVCQVHLGMMQGALQAWHAPWAVDRLRPFVEPDLCLTQLSAAGSGAGEIALSGAHSGAGSGRRLAGG